jgi:hypothetical protein
MGERYRGRGQWDGPRGQPGSRDREVSFVDSVGSGGEESHNPLRIPNLPSVRTSQPSHSLRTHCAGRCATAKRFPRFASGGGCRTVWCGVWLPYAGLGGLAQRTGATEPYSQRPVYIHMHLSAHGCTGRASDVKHRDFRCVCAVGDERPPAGHQRRPQRASRVSEPVPQRRQHAAPRQHARFLPVVARLHPAPCVQG